MKEEMSRLESFLAGEYLSTNYVEVVNFDGDLIGYAGRIDDINALSKHISLVKRSQPILRHKQKSIINQMLLGSERIAQWYNNNMPSLTRLFCLESGYPIKHCEELYAVVRDYFLQLPSFIETHKAFLKSERGFELNYSFFDPYDRSVSYARYPYGVILSITPSNVPVPLIPLMITSAVLSGNCVVIRPSSKNILTSLKQIEPFMTVDIPKRSINIVNAPIDKILKTGFEHNFFDLIHYTGSNKYLPPLVTAAVQNGVDIIGEGEGNGMVMVDSNINIPETVGTLIRALSRCNGQLCTTPHGILVHHDIYEDFCEQLAEDLEKLVVGNPLSRYTDIGPLFTIQQAENLQQRMQYVTRNGAKILVGANREGAFLYPTLIKDIKPDMDIVRTEPFGPVFWLSSLANYREAMSFFRYNKYGLNLTIFSRTPQEILSVFGKAPVNRICVNCDPTIQSPFSPWGAMKKSGMSSTEVLPLKYSRKVMVVDEGARARSLKSKIDLEFETLVLKKPETIELVKFSTKNMANQNMIVEMLWSGICGSDKQAYLGELNVPYPIVLGHENLGRIYSIPENMGMDIHGRTLDIGDVVSWPAIIPCRTCLFCKSHRENLCTRQRVFGLSYTAAMPPHVLGGWSQYTFLPSHSPIMKLDKDSQDPVMVLSEPLATTLILDTLKSEIQNSKVQNALIFGSGTLGALFAFYARILGIREIAAFGSKKRRKVIKNFVNRYFPREEIKTESELIPHDEYGYDLVIDSSSIPQLSKIVNLVKPGGTILEVGAVGSTPSFLDLSRIVKKNVRIIGHIAYSINEFSRSFELVRRNKEILRPLISGIFPLKDYSEAIAKSLSSNTFKVVFKPN